MFLALLNFSLKNCAAKNKTETIIDDNLFKLQINKNIDKINYL